MPDGECIYAHYDTQCRKMATREERDGDNHSVLGDILDELDTVKGAVSHNIDTIIRKDRSLNELGHQLEEIENANVMFLSNPITSEIDSDLNDCEQHDLQHTGTLSSGCNTGITMLKQKMKCLRKRCVLTVVTVMTLIVVLIIIVVITVCGPDLSRCSSP